MKCAVAIALLLTAPAFAGEAICNLGDSVTVGTGGATPYPTTLCATLADGSTCANLGVAGQTVAEIRARYCADCVFDRTCQVLMPMMGINSLRANVSAATIYVDYLVMLEDAWARGRRVVIISTTPAHLTAPQEVQRGLLNDSLAAWVVAKADAVRAIFVDMDPLLDADSDGELDSAPTDYNDDGIHPTAAGYNLIATTAAADGF